jgi:hypothetical protein
MRSQFFGNRLLSPEFNKAYMCPEISQEELDKLKGFETGSKAKDDELAKLKADLEKHTKKPDPDPADPSLADKVRKDQEAKDAATKREKSLEGAIGFTHASKDFLKANSGLLPKTIEGVFAQAEKEKYDSAIDKANAIKVEIVREFFSVQANLDLLTQTQKNEVDEFLKLSKNGMQGRIESMYSMVFEPTLETLRKVEKAKQLQIDPKNQSDAEKVLTDKMLKASKKHYLGDKE